MVKDREYDNILIIRTHRIGDILQVTPMIRGLREKYPRARISILVEQGFQEVVHQNPDLDEVIPFPRVRFTRFIQEEKRFPWGVYRALRDLIRSLKARRFDLVINRQFTDAEAILASLIEPGEVRGKVMDQSGNFFYADPVTARVVEQTMKQGRNPGLKNLVDLSIEVGGAAPAKRRLVFPVSQGVEEACRQRLLHQGFSPSDPVAGIQAGASRSFKKLGSRALGAVVDHLIKNKGYKILFFGSRQERSLGERILSEVGSDKSAVLNLMGETTLEELGGCLMQCNFLVTGDTGTMHLAAAVGTRTISTSYGMTYPYETAPYGPEHLILYSDLPCAPCDDPHLCTHDRACERVLLPEVLVPGIEAAMALWEGDAGRVRERVDLPALEGVRLLYTGKGEGRGDLKLYDLRQGIPDLKRPGPAASVQRQGQGMDAKQKLPGILAAVRNIRTQIEKALQEFSRGSKVDGFQSILPVFDLWNRVIQNSAEMEYALDPSGKGTAQQLTELHEGLVPVLNRLSSAMEQMDLSTLQDILSGEMAALAAEEERVFTRILHE